MAAFQDVIMRFKNTLSDVGLRSTDKRRATFPRMKATATVQEIQDTDPVVAVVSMGQEWGDKLSRERIEIESNDSTCSDSPRSTATDGSVSLVNEIQQPPQRQLGFPVYLSHDVSTNGDATRNISVLSLSDAALDTQIKSLLWQHGVICVKSQNLTPTEMLYLAERFGETFVLPKMFGTRCSEQPEIIRIGNVREDGKIISRHAAAEYWHHDGDFRARPEHALINFLHAKITPDVGGKTGFLDLTGAYHAAGDNRVFSENVKSKLRNSSVVVDPMEIEDFKQEKARQDKMKVDSREADNAAVADDSIDAFLSAVEHPVISPHPVTGTPVMYLPESGKGVLEQQTHDSWISCEELWEAVKCGKTLSVAEFGDEEVSGHDNQALEEDSNREKLNFVYEHQWEEGDLMIWDNTQLMHRSMGGFGDQARLLYRAQATYQGSFC